MLPFNIRYTYTLDLHCYFKTSALTLFSDKALLRNLGQLLLSLLVVKVQFRSLHHVHFAVAPPIIFLTHNELNLETKLELMMQAALKIIGLVLLMIDLLKEI